jgi:lysophospholipase L1-like esterase
MRFRLLQLLLCACVCVCFVALLEGFERSSSYFDLAQDPQTGIARYRPGSSIRWGREGYGVTSIGPHGMIVNKPLDDKPRILFLGDSYTEALQVHDAEKFTEITQTAYNQRFPASPITTLNFAVSGQSAAQHVADLEGLLPVLRPRAVVVQLSTLDFLPDDLKRRIPTQPAWLGIAADGAPEIRRGSITPEKTLRARLQKARLFSTYARISWRLQNLLTDAPNETNTESASPPTETYANEYKHLARFLLGKMKQECENAGVPLAALYNPRAPLLRGNLLFMQEADFGSGHEAEKAALFELCRELAIPVWDPTGRLTGYYRATGQFPNGFANSRPGYGHLNPAGHRVVAGLIVEELAKLLNSSALP